MAGAPSTVSPVLKVHFSSSWSGNATGLGGATPVIVGLPRETGQSAVTNAGENTTARSTAGRSRDMAVPQGLPRGLIQFENLGLGHRPGVEPGRPLLTPFLSEQREDSVADTTLFQGLWKAGGSGQSHNPQRQHFACRLAVGKSTLVNQLRVERANERRVKPNHVRQHQADGDAV